MALDTYANLQTSIATWADRNDAAFIAAIPDFISMFEVNANAELPLRTRFNLATATLATVANTSTVTLPTDFLEAKALINTSTSNPIDVLSYYPAAQLYTAFPTAITVPDRPKGFTYVGSTLELAPTPDAIYNLKLYYYQKVTALSALAPSNWLLANFPNLYLFGALVAAEAWLGTDPRIKEWGDLYDNLVQKLSGSNERGQYGGTPLQVRIDTGV